MSKELEKAQHAIRELTMDMSGAEYQSEVVNWSENED